MLIGVTFLIAVVSIVQGMNRYMVEEFANTLVGANTFELRQRPSIVTGNVSDEVWLAWRRRPRISYDDADYVRERVRTPATFAKFCEDYVSVHYGGKVAKSIRLAGTEESYFKIRNYEIAAGRAFTSQEVRTAQPVLVIGQELADKLLKGIDPIDKKVVIGGLPYRVIGVVAKQGNLFGISMDKFAIMPFSAQARRLICPINILDALIVQTADPTQMQAGHGPDGSHHAEPAPAQARAGEQFRVSNRGRGPGQLAEDLARCSSWRCPGWWPSRSWWAGS